MTPLLHYLPLTIATAADLWDRIGTIVGIVLFSAATYVAGEFIHWRARLRAARPHRPLRDLHEKDTEIKIRIARCMWQLGEDCMRGYLGQYRNGDSFASKADVYRKWRTHEVTRPGVQPQNTLFDGMLLSRLTEETKLVLEDGASWTLVRDLPECEFKAICETGGTVSTARARIGKADDPVGFIGADFDTELKPEHVEALCACAIDVGRMLAGYGKR